MDAAYELLAARSVALAGAQLAQLAAQVEIGSQFANRFHDLQVCFLRGGRFACVLYELEHADHLVVGHQWAEDQ